MELTVGKRELMKIATRMGNVAQRKSTMPILSCVLLEAESNGDVRLAATDLYLSLSGKASADVAKPGSVAVSAKDLLDRVKMMPDGPVVISVQDKGTTTLKSKGTARRYTLRGMPGMDFPPLPKAAEDAATLAIEARVLSDLIAKTHFSVSADETRPHLNSALFEWDGEVVRMVSTDGHRLTKVESKVAGRQASATMLIPLKALHELRRICDELLAEPQAEGAPAPELRITQSGSTAFFEGGGTTFAVKLVDAQFPPYAQVIPKSSDKVVGASRFDLSDALKAIAVAASEKTGGVKLALTRGLMRITGESADSGDGSDEISIDYDGPNLSMGFAAKYLLDVLGALPNEKVTIGFTGELDPGVIRTEVGDGSDFVAVIMPLGI